MRREIFIRLSFLISVLILVSIVKHWLALTCWPLWLGGALGLFLPDLDHLVYIFFLGPQELTSQRVVYLIRNKNFRGAVSLLFDTRAERGDLVLHSNFAFVVILIFTFWMLTSSGSLLGVGLVLGMVVHLLVDRIKNVLYHEIP